MNLKNLLHEIDENRKWAEQDISALPVRTRPALETAVKEAQIRLKDLVDQYQKSVTQNAVGVMVVGPKEQAKQFAELAEETGGTFTLDGNLLYYTLATVVDSTLGHTRVFEPANMARLTSAIRDAAVDLGITTMNAPKYREKLLPTLDDTVALVRDLVREAAGDSMNVLFLRKQLAQGALEQRYTGAVTPVVIVNVTEDEMGGLKPLLPKGSTVASLSSETAVTKEKVIETFQIIVQSARGAKKNG